MELLANPLIWVAVALFAAALVGGVWWKKKRSPISGAKPAKEETSPGGPITEEPAPETVKKKPEPPRIRPVRQRELVEYFQDINKIQLGAGPAATSDIELVERRQEHSTHIWMLRVRHKDKWQERRATIAAIGEGSASRSRCFYVIFNTHMVVKVPPDPVTDFGQYIRSTKKEWKLANRLAPRPAIVPRVSVILKLVHPIAQQKDWSEDDLEKRYIQLAGQNPKIQEHLKIGGAFCFFMDLAEYMFLGNIIRELLGSEDLLAEEIAGFSDVLRDADCFEGRYGESGMSTCMSLQQVFAGFEAAAKDLLLSPDESGTAMLYKLPQWFMIGVAGRDLTQKNTELPPAALASLQGLLEKTLSENKEAVEEYKEVIEQHLHKLTFSQNKPRMTGIAANLVDLLAWLRAKGVAVRDLKPDNLVVAGDTDKYPGYLTTPSEFSIGLIDLETSLVFRPGDGKELEQPPLAGTPIYATPTHLLDNSLLAELYDDWPLILHLQDWYATLAMIYLLFTSKPLFTRTARSLPGVMKVLSAPEARSGSQRAHFAKEASRMFWAGALREFRGKMTLNKELFSQIQIPLQDSALVLLRPDLEKGLFNRPKLRDGVLARLQGKTPQLSVRLLLEAMYYRVMDTMYNPEWGSLIDKTKAGK